MKTNKFFSMLAISAACVALTACGGGSDEKPASGGSNSGGTSSFTPTAAKSLPDNKETYGKQFGESMTSTPASFVVFTEDAKVNAYNSYIYKTSDAQAFGLDGFVIIQDDDGHTFTQNTKDGKEYPGKTLGADGKLALGCSGTDYKNTFAAIAATADELAAAAIDPTTLKGVTLDAYDCEYITDGGGTGEWKFSDDGKSIATDDGENVSVADLFGENGFKADGKTFFAKAYSLNNTAFVITKTPNEAGVVIYLPQ